MEVFAIIAKYLHDLYLDIIGDADDQCLYLNDIYKTQMDMYLYILETACLDICSLH